jgi:hypothetical protein
MIRGYFIVLIIAGFPEFGDNFCCQRLQVDVSALGPQQIEQLDVTTNLQEAESGDEATPVSEGYFSA